MSKAGVRPEDVLPDGEDFVDISGVRVRKGSIAAAMRNMELLERGSEEEKRRALSAIEDLAPGLAVLGLHRHFQCRNPQVEAILAEAAKRVNASGRR